MNIKFINFFILSVLFSSSVANSQYYENYFGTNKVHYKQFDWNILETEHFEIYYYPEMRELAERAAGMAEEQYLELQTRFNHALIKKVPMIIYSSHIHFQQTNTTPGELPEGIGGFFEFFKGRVVLPSDGSTTNFRRVIRHELVHVFMDSKVNRILGQHRKYNHPGAPLWFTEGLAELWSGQPDFQAEMVVRDATLNNTIVPVQEFWRVEGTYYMYKLGENFLHFVEETYGRETVLLLMENIWKYEEFQKVVVLTLGKNYEALSREWVYWLKKKYFPTISDHDVPSAVSKALTRDGFSAKPAYYSDGKMETVIYVANRDGYTNIYAQPVNGTRSEILIKGERSEAFETFHLFKSKMDVSKNGELAFAVKSGEQDVLYVYDLVKRAITHQYKYKDLVGIASPSWSPDGKRIVFSGLSLSGNDDLYILDVTEGDQDGALLRLTNDFYDDKEPAWSPDGQYIAFSSDRGQFSPEGTYNLYLYDVTKGQFLLLTTGPFHDFAPSWSPKGDWLAFTSNRLSSPTNIWAMPFVVEGRSFPEAASGSPMDSILTDYAPRQLTKLTSAVFDPVWTKSGDLIFSAFEDFSFKIRKLDSAYAKATATLPGERTTWSGYKKFWSTPKVPIRNTNSKPYERRYGLDFVQGAFQVDPVFGYGGGAVIGVTDMLGNDQYYLTLYNTGRTAGSVLTDWNFVATRVNLAQRANYAYGIYRFKGDFFEIGDQGSVDIVSENRYGGFFQVSYPLSKFQRVETSVNLSRFRRGSSFGSLLPLNGVLVGNFIGYTFDNSLWGFTGPLDGRRFGLSLGYMTDIYQSQQNYYTVILDNRNYYRITTRSAYAVRTLVEWNGGKNPTNFLIGGSWDLRGYPRWNMPGTRFFVVNNELRFPFVDAVNLNFPLIGLGLRSIRGAVFMDVGNAWGSQITDGRVILRHQKFDGLVGSVGTGFRINLLGFLVMRFDFGKMFDARGYRFGNSLKLPGNRDRFIATKLKDTGQDEGFGGRQDDGTLLEPRRWSRGIFFQFWFGVDY